MARACLLLSYEDTPHPHINSRMSSQQRDLCVLFADVSGSTRLYEKLGDAEALHAVERCVKRMERASAIYGGRLIKTIGDEVMVAFDTADSAMQAACEMQQRIDDLPPVSGVKLSIRVGFHFGTVIEDGNDCFGDTVNLAARMVGLAKAGQIITTGDTVARLSPLLQKSTRDLDALAVKGKRDDVAVFEVIWQEGVDLTMKAQTTIKPPPAGQLIVKHSGNTLSLDTARDALTMGRDTVNDVVIIDRRASRSHARIERRRDKFVLIDQSTNGTFVTFDGEVEFALKHEEVILRNRGVVSFGHSHHDAGAEIVEFEVRA